MRLTREKAKRIENYLQAIDMVKSLPPRMFVTNLNDWRSGGHCTIKGETHRCGSAACLGGWIAQHPYFQKLGVEPDEDGAPLLNKAFPGETAYKLFGSYGMFDAHNDEYGKPGKKIALERLRKGLEEELE